MTFNAPELRELLKEVLDETLDRRNRIDAETHELHHQWVTSRIECDRRRRAIFDGVIKTVLGATGVTGLAWLGSQILDAVRGGGGA